MNRPEDSAYSEECAGTDAQSGSTGETDAGSAENGKKTPKIRRICTAFLLILLIFCLGGGIMLQTALVPLSAEAGAPLPAEADFLRWPFLPASCLTEITEDITGQIGTHTVRFSLFGMNRETTLTVTDTKPPVFTLRDVSVLSGAPVTAEDFIESAEDFSDFTAEPESPLPTKPGVHTVRFVFTDAYGNSAVGEAALTVLSLSADITVEAGITAAQLQKTLSDQLPEAKPDPSAAKTDLKTPGQRQISVQIDGAHYTVTLTVQDTAAPAGTTQDVRILQGGSLLAEDFFSEIRDATEVTADYDGNPPDTGTAGTKSVSLLLTDAAGNISAHTATLHVLPLQAVYTAEAGTPFIEFFVSLPLDMAGASFTELPDISVLDAGEYTLPVSTPHGTFDMKVQVRDTVAPTAVGCTVVYHLGDTEEPKPADFVTGIRDASAVTAAFAVPPDLTMLGNQPVTVRLTDAAGNTADIHATVSVQNDREAPLIRGVKNLSVYVGGTVSYKSGVTAVDGGVSVSVTVDSSRVNLKVPGTYTVYYSAADAAGNSATVSATVTVSEVTYDVIAEQADGILKKILKTGMTNRQKARAVYDWMKANVSYVAYPDKTYWMRAAYHGFLNGRGDCYVYYAMSRILLDRAGIENMEIHRNDDENPHFWNLVNCGDGWYHFDTCPHYRQYPLESFMLTDAEVKAYSDNYVKDYYSFDESLYPDTP